MKLVHSIPQRAAVAGEVHLGGAEAAKGLRLLTTDTVGGLAEAVEKRSPTRIGVEVEVPELHRCARLVVRRMAVRGDDWKLEVVSVNAAYNNERLLIFVFLPIHGTPPYQPVVLFPGTDGFFESHFDPHWIEGYRDYTFITKSGRALILPIYKATFERQDGLRSMLPSESVVYKDHVVMWAKDVSRTIDYLETRKDMHADRIAYVGVGWGGFLGAIMPAVERRIRVVVLKVAGLSMEQAPPEADQINYLPRVTQPVLMMNGEYDSYFPLETAQKPLYRLLGTPADEKKMIVYPSAHLVPRVEFMKETLAWLDRYLGPAQGVAQ